MTEPLRVPKEFEEYCMSAREVSEFLGVHRNTVCNWVRDGKIPYIRIGRRKLMFRKVDAEGMRVQHD